MAVKSAKTWLDRCLTKENLKGFTLLELLVVCTLIMILLVVSVPSFRNTLFSSPFHNGTRKVVRTINQARQDALTSRYGCYLIVNIDENRLWHQCPLSASLVMEKPEEERATLLPASLRISSVRSKMRRGADGGTAMIWINPRGMMEETIINISDGTKTMALVTSVFLPDIQLIPEELSLGDLVKK